MPPQDFEALTPNLLARTVETVEGGGLVVLLLSSLNSLEQLYTLTMDSHARLRTESHQVRRCAGAGRGAEADCLHAPTTCVQVHQLPAHLWPCPYICVCLSVCDVR